MKDFENDLIYYPHPDPIEEPRFILNSVEELEKSTKYSVICNGTERVVYHTDSFDYVIVVDDEAYDLEISIHTPFEKLAIRPTSFGIVPSVTGETVQIHLDEPKKFTVETALSPNLSQRGGLRSLVEIRRAELKNRKIRRSVLKKGKYIMSGFLP